MRLVQDDDDLRTTERLAPGDECEFRFPARSTWLKAVVVTNGGVSLWKVRMAEPAEGHDAGHEVDGLYIEHVRAPGTDPWGH